MADIRLITFDLDNTLCDVGQVIGHAEAEMYAWLDAHVPEYRLAFDREALLAIRRRIVAEHPAMGHDVSALREEVLYRGLRSLDLDESRAREHARTAYQIFYQARQEVVFFEHALESLALLKRRYQLAALTNGNAHIERIGLDRYFGFAYSSADVSASKPAPDIFHAALEKAGVRASQAIHVGDNLVDDIHGAQRVGMHTIWVKQPEQSDDDAPSRPSQTIEHLRDLPGAVGRIHNG